MAVLAYYFDYNLGHGEGISIAYIYHCMVLTLPLDVKLHPNSALQYLVCTHYQE